MSSLPDSVLRDIRDDLQTALADFIHSFPTDMYFV